MLLKIKHERVDLYFQIASIEFHENENKQLVSSIYRNDVPRSTDILGQVIVDFYNVSQTENQLIFTSTLKNVGQTFSISHKELSNGVLTIEGNAFDKNISFTFRSLKEGRGLIDNVNYSLKLIETQPTQLPNDFFNKETDQVEGDNTQNNQGNRTEYAFYDIRRYTHQFEDYITQYIPLFKEWARFFYVLFFIIFLEISFLIYLACSRCCCISNSKQENKQNNKKVHVPTENKEKVD